MLTDRINSRLNFRAFLNIANVQEQCFDCLDAPILRVSSADVPKPYAKELELSCIPDRQKVADAARRALA